MQVTHSVRSTPRCPVKQSFLRNWDYLVGIPYLVKSFREFANFPIIHSLIRILRL